MKKLKCWEWDKWRKIMGSRKVAVGGKIPVICCEVEKLT